MARLRIALTWQNRTAGGLNIMTENGIISARVGVQRNCDLFLILGLTFG